MIYKHGVHSKVSLRDYLRWQWDDWIKNVGQFRVSPIKSDLRHAFIVGCGNSGTTLTAAKLGNHRAIHLVPKETHAFKPRNGLRRSRQDAQQWQQSARNYDCSVVLEKTPKHVHCISRIRRVLPDAKIIALTRHPVDNVASLAARLGSFEQALTRWLVDNRALLKLTSQTNVKIVAYERLTTLPVNVFSELCDFLDLDRDPALLDPRPSAYDTREQHGTMALRRIQVGAAIHRPSYRHRHALSDSQKQIVSERTLALKHELDRLTSVS